jgi:hypothetical protein
MTNCAFTNVETLVDVPPRVVKPAEIDKIFDSGFSVPPAMSLYAPGKANPVCPTFIEHLRSCWESAVLTADLVLIVGAHPNPNDPHIWEPIASATADLLYIGGTGDLRFEDFSKRVGPRLAVLGTHFDETTIDRVNDRLKA